MAKVTNVNTLPATGAEATFDLKENLKLAGWTVLESSDGTTYNASGDQITHGGGGANGMNNSRAWFRITDPVGRREWTFQGETTNPDTDFRVTYSALAKHILGTPSASQVPEAADEVVLHGSGTAASPSMTKMWPDNGTYRAHHIARDDAQGNVYGWWTMASTTAGDPFSLHFCEPMAVDSYPVEDADPCVVAVFNGGTVEDFLGMNFSNDSLANPLCSYFKHGLTDEAVMNDGDTVFANIESDSSGVLPQGNTSEDQRENPYNGQDDKYPVPVFQRDVTMTVPSARSGVDVWKGWCANIRYHGYHNTNRNYPSTVGLTDTHVYFDDLLIPYEDGTEALL